MREEKVRLFSDVQAIQSERASDFDVYSAYGEVLDNSIEAESKKIKLKFSTSVDKSRGRNFLHIKSLAFGDDGIGMSSEILHRCLQLGYSSRYGSRKGIGRFGVGMTKGAISQCKRIDIYSKEQKSKKWLYTYFDIDEITSKGAFINEPVEKEIPNEFKDLIDPSSGTLVIWSKFDRQDKSANEIVNESKIWIGRTFRKFIFEGRNFYIDGQEVKAVDPLYLNPQFTAFPNDPVAEKWGEDDVFEWEIDDPDLADKVSAKKSKIIIRHSWLPKEFLAKGGGRSKAGDHPDNKERCIDRNEGISILRNNREVRDPEYDIPFWSPKFEAVDRWWGCEISFSSELDNWFQVKNIKRGAAPLKELREELQKRINSVRRSIRAKTQEYWDSINTPQPVPRGMEVDPNHGKSTKIATDTIADTKPKDKLSKNKKLENEIEKFVTSRYKNLTAEKIKGFSDYFRNNHITILESPSNSANFFEITHFGSGKSNITYNTNHLFCTKYFQILSELKAVNSNQNANQNDILVLIDLLLIAYSLAESQFDPEANFKAEDFFEDMMRNWGKSLRDLLKKWNEYESNS